MWSLRNKIRFPLILALGLFLIGASPFAAEKKAEKPKIEKVKADKQKEKESKKEKTEKPKAKAVILFNGKDLSEWHGLSEASQWQVAKDAKLGEKDNKRFDIVPGEGIMVNGAGGNTCNLLSDYKHGDCRLHIEFNVPVGSNSGVYFQGLYEIQVLDSYQKTDLKYGDCGGVYARHKDGQDYEGHPPLVNASKAPGEWQSFDVVFRAPRFNEKGEKTENAKFMKVAHNGTVVHKNVEVTGPTRASLNESRQAPEAPAGPLMLQGDHGPVAYRNIKLTPLELK
ncbi:MAG: DUF1080 domain-containing protein [Candidatus Omnitrophota bacterium]